MAWVARALGWRVLAWGARGRGTREGAEKSGRGAAGFNRIGVGFEDGFEGRDRGEAEGMFLTGLMVGDVGGDIRARGSDVKGEKVVGWRELFGERLEVLIEGEETEQDCRIGW